MTDFHCCLSCKLLRLANQLTPGAICLSPALAHTVSNGAEGPQRTCRLCIRGVKLEWADIRLSTSAHFPPLGSWYTAAARGMSCLLRGWRKGNLSGDDSGEETRSVCRNLPASQDSPPYLKYCCSFKITFQDILPY